MAHHPHQRRQQPTQQQHQRQRLPQRPIRRQTRLKTRRHKNHPATHQREESKSGRKYVKVSRHGIAHRAPSIVSPLNSPLDALQVASDNRLWLRTLPTATKMTLPDWFKPASTSSPVASSWKVPKWNRGLRGCCKGDAAAVVTCRGHRSGTSLFLSATQSPLFCRTYHASYLCCGK